MFTNTQSRKRTSTNENSDGLRNRNEKRGMIREETMMPVRIISCQEGKPTQYGTETLFFSFQHLISEEEFNSTVFEQSAPAYVDEQILNAVLPPGALDYSLADLADKGLFVQVRFNGDYINIVKALPLDEKHRRKLIELLENEEREQQEFEEEMSGIEEEMDDVDLDEIGSEDDDLDLDDIDESA